MLGKRYYRFIPMLVAAWLFWMGITDLLTLWPEDTKRIQGQRSSQRSPLLDLLGSESQRLEFKQGIAADSGLQVHGMIPGSGASVAKAARGAGGPFRLVGGAEQAKNTRSAGWRPPPPPPSRRFVLKGTVGTEVATVGLASGRSVIVRVGDRVDSAEVLQINPGRIVLRDRAGRFELVRDAK